MNTLFTALLLVCNMQTTIPDCKGMANPLLYDSLDQCLASAAEGISIFEGNGFKVVRYQCYEWTTGQDLEAMDL